MLAKTVVRLETTGIKCPLVKKLRHLGSPTWQKWPNTHVVTVLETTFLSMLALVRRPEVTLLVGKRSISGVIMVTAPITTLQVIIVVSVDMLLPPAKLRVILTVKTSGTPVKMELFVLVTIRDIMVGS